MINKINYISLVEVLNRVLRHPLLQDLDLESAIYYAVDFIRILGVPELYIDSVEKVKIAKYKGKLPCNIVAVTMVRDAKTQECLQSTTDAFYNTSSKEDSCHATYKLQGDYIYSSMENGELEVAYSSIAIDDNGIPLIPDNPIFLRALELYIKKEYFTILFDMNKINAGVYANTTQEYAWAVGSATAEFNLPSYAEMETVTNVWNQLLPEKNPFKHGFKDLGNKGIYKR